VSLRPAPGSTDRGDHRAFEVYASGIRRRVSASFILHPLRIGSGQWSRRRAGGAGSAGASRRRAACARRPDPNTQNLLAVHVDLGGPGIQGLLQRGDVRLDRQETSPPFQPRRQRFRRRRPAGVHLGGVVARKATRKRDGNSETCRKFRQVPGLCRSAIDLTS